jgi:hypothetical protein
MVRHQHLLLSDKHGDLEREAMNMKHAEFFEISNKDCSELYLREVG